MNEDRLAHAADDEDSPEQIHSHTGEDCPTCGKDLADCPCFEDDETI